MAGQEGMHPDQQGVSDKKIKTGEQQHYVIDEQLGLCAVFGSSPP